MRVGVVGAGDVVGLVRERFARSVGIFLVLGAGLADGILRGVVPGNTRLAVYVNPLAMHVAKRPPGVAVFLERDEESVSRSVTDFPFPHEVIA